MIPPTLPLRPTLWRTCRVLANRTRLQLLQGLFQRPHQCVSALAEHFHLPLPVASQSLRALEARGILTARRTGRRVIYQPATEVTPGLVAALRQTFADEARPVETVFALATAFTHPRRIEIFRLLQGEPRSASQLCALTRASWRAVLRQARKLEARGFAAREARAYQQAVPPNPLGRVLARLASAPE